MNYKAPVAAALSVAAVVSPLAARDYTARHRIARQQRELDQLHYEIVALRQNQEHAALQINFMTRCLGNTLPILVRNDGTIAVAYTDASRQYSLGVSQPAGCDPGP